MKQLGNSCVKRVERDKDLAIAVTGPEGDGKSALSIGLGLKIDPLFLLKRNVLFSPSVKEIKQKIYNLPPYSVILADEAIKILYKLNWQSKVQKYLNTIYTICRNQNKISLFNIPRLIDANEYFRNHRLKLWVHIVDPISSEKKEGHACIMARSWNPVTVDPWGLKVFEKKMVDERKRGKKDVVYSLDEKINLFSELPSFVDILKFKWIDNDIWKDYLELKETYSIKDEEDMEDDKAIIESRAWRKRIVIAVKTFMSMGYTKQSIAKLFHVHVTSVTGWLKKYEQEEELKKINQST